MSNKKRKESAQSKGGKARWAKVKNKVERSKIMRNVRRGVKTSQ